MKTGSAPQLLQGLLYLSTEELTEADKTLSAMYTVKKKENIYTSKREEFIYIAGLHSKETIITLKWLLPLPVPETPPVNKESQHNSVHLYLENLNTSNKSDVLLPVLRTGWPVCALPF